MFLLFDSKCDLKSAFKVSCCTTAGKVLLLVPERVDVDVFAELSPWLGHGFLHQETAKVQDTCPCYIFLIVVCTTRLHAKLPPDVELLCKMCQAVCGWRSNGGEH